MTTLGRASAIRAASSAAAKPPKTTECTAPSRAQASIATGGFRHHRQVDHHPVALADAERRQRPGQLRDPLQQPRHR